MVPPSERRWMERPRGRIRVLVRWLLVACWMGVLFALCATPSFASPFAPIDDLLLRTLAHVTVYAV